MHKRIVTGSLLPTMRKIIIFISVLLSVLPTLSPGVARADESGPTHGWFWYQTEPPPEDDTPKPKPKEAEQKPVTPPADAKPEEPPVLSVAWLRTHLSTARDKAIDDPTVENVGTYLALQKVMFDKAKNFADMGKVALQAYPALNPGTFVPVDAASLRNFDAYKDQVRPVALNAIVKQAGLWFFFESTCAFCELEAQQLGEFAHEVPGMHLMAISVDGKPLPGSAHAHDVWVRDTGQAKHLHVTLFPTVVMVWPPNNFAMVAQGAEASSVIESNLLQVAADHGLLTKDMIAWVKPYERGVMTPLQINSTKPSDIQDSSKLLDYVTHATFDQSER